MLKRSLDLVIPFVFLFAALLLWIDEGTAIRELRAIVFDSYQRLLPRSYEAPPVRIVDIDEPSLKALGQWPWPRERLAELVDRLTAQGAAAVVLDILLSEPDRTGPARLAELWSDRPDIEAIRSALAVLPDPDRRLAEALAASPSVVAFLLAPNGGEIALPHKAGMATAGDDPVQFLPQLPRAVPALDIFTEAAQGYGSVNVVPDTDGVTRRVALFFAYRGEAYPTLGAESLRVAQGAGSYVIKSSGASGELSFGRQTGIAQVKIGGAIVPTDAYGALLLYDSGHRPERFVSASEVLAGTNDPAAIAGHIVLIGSSAEALKDLKPTPLDPTMPGVEVTAQAIEQMIGGQFLYRPDWAAGAELLFLLLFGTLIILATRRLGAIGSAIFAVAACMIAAEASWLAFKREGWLVDPLFPCGVAIALYISSSFLGYLRAENERRQIRTTFGKYLSPILVKELQRHPERFKLGGEVRELTLMFMDIQGFTSLAEKLEPETVTRIINRLLTRMTGIIQGEQGLVDKYIGDCIMAFWNAPLDVPNHARNALAAAVAMREELARLNVEWSHEAPANGDVAIDLKIGIGLNTGRCSVGDMGSDQQHAYTAIGDAVNLASRLEGLTRAYGVDLLIGESTAALLPDVPLLEVDLVQVKGRAQPLAIFTPAPAGPRNGADRQAELLRRHGELRTNYRSGRWAEAAAALADLEAIAAAEFPYLQALYGLYDRRLAEFRADPPPPEWDGVYRASTKSG
ncbi:MAG: CHASE2 domain-containing protein [Dongiaceae bacterium]